MKATEFKVWINSLDRMSRGQRNNIRDRLKGKTSANTVVSLIEKNLNDKHIRFRCKGQKKYRYGQKEHVLIDIQSGLINKIAATFAGMTDSSRCSYIGI